MRSAARGSGETESQADGRREVLVEGVGDLPGPPQAFGVLGQTGAQLLGHVRREDDAVRSVALHQGAEPEVRLGPGIGFRNQDQAGLPQQGWIDQGGQRDRLGQADHLGTLALRLPEQLGRGAHPWAPAGSWSARPRVRRTVRALVERSQGRIRMHGFSSAGQRAGA